MTDLKLAGFEALADMSAVAWIFGSEKKGAIFRPIRHLGAIVTVEGGRTLFDRLPSLSRQRAFKLLSVQ